MYWERVMRRKEREKRSPPARITLWRQVGDCTSLGMFLFNWLFPLVGGPASRRFHPSIPVVIPLEGLTKVDCVGAPRGTVLWDGKGPPKRACLPLFHNIGSTTSLLTQYKALSYGFARRLSYGFATAINEQS